MSKIKAPTPATAWTSLEAAMLSERLGAKGHVVCSHWCEVSRTGTRPDGVADGVRGEPVEVAWA